jgi:hypothetical protein
VPNIAAFQERIDLSAWAQRNYWVLSNYVHIKGAAYSNHQMWHSNLPHFNEEVLLRWSRALKMVTQIVATIHVLKYPIALQETPMDEKFGLNAPWGHFLRPGQSEALKEFLPERVRTVTQEISDADDAATRLAAQIRALPDITDEQLTIQAENQDKWYIEMNGFAEWAKSHWDPIYAGKGNEEAQARKTRLEAWARETSNYEAKPRG